MHFTLSTLRGFVFYNLIAPDGRFQERQEEVLFSFLKAEKRLTGSMAARIQQHFTTEDP